MLASLMPLHLGSGSKTGWASRQGGLGFFVLIFILDTTHPQTSLDRLVMTFVTCRMLLRN